MTDDSNQRTYEELRSKISDLRPAGVDERRALVWCSDAQVLAASRGRRGELEIFLLGPPLGSTTELVREILSHDTWKRDDGSTITASRLVFPPADPFDAITTFLCIELLRNGVDDNAQDALRASEPIIEAVLQRVRLQSESLLGLMGELLVLLQLIRASPDRFADVFRSWHGPTRSSRDLQLGGVGVEVKTTRGPHSTHHAQGVRQVEIGHAVGGVDESVLYLVSVGLEPAEPGAGHTLPGLVEALVEQIQLHAGPGADETTDRFLVDVASYGLGANQGYLHREMKGLEVFSQGWNVAFCRTYDMTDPGVQLLRTEDVAPRAMVDLESVTFQIRLPDQVSGDTNPSLGLPAMASRVWAAVG